MRSTILRSGALASAAAAVAAVALGTAAGRRADERAFEALNRGHGSAADRAFAGITELGSLYAVAAAAGTLAVLGQRAVAARALCAAGATWLACRGVKHVVGRPRPYHAAPEDTRRMIAPPAGTSWPSSHPAVLTTFTRVAARELGLPPAPRVALGALDVTVATSRVYLGVHYPSDVLGGLLLGRALAHVWPRAQ